MANHALVVDLRLIYRLTKVELKEEPGHECVHCVLEASCDQRQWWPIHTFTPGAGEVAEFGAEAEAAAAAGAAAGAGAGAPPREELDEMGFALERAVPTPR
jgi:hypothetical protein